MKRLTRFFLSFFLSAFIFGMISFPVHLKAQDKVSPRLDIGYFQVDSALRYLVVKVRKKVEKRFESLDSITVGLSLDLPAGTMEVGSVLTNAKGEGKVILEERVITALRDVDEYSFTGEISETDVLNAASETLVIKPSRLKIETNDADKSIKVSLLAKTDGSWQPVEGAELGVFITRRFGKVPVEEPTYTTDENGQVALTFDTEIPGDAQGFLTLESSIEDNDELGNISATVKAKWGSPLTVSEGFNRRTLWSTRDKTPWWLLVFPNAMIAAVWGVIIYLVVLLFKIKKLAGS